MPPLRPDHISVSNVRPAYETSLAMGVGEHELAALGLPRDVIDDDEATISGDVTYAHMELMEARFPVGDFLVDAAQRHTIVSLGVVGLSCKTLPTVGAAFACHQRFQHLTNRTASYAVTSEAGLLTLTEHRWGAPRRGSLVLSDYTLLVATQLLRAVAAETVRVVAAHSRRDHLGTAERQALERFLGAPIVTGAQRAALVLHSDVLTTPVASADPELAAYFRGVLARAAHLDADEPALVSQVRVAIQDALVTGTPTGVEIGRRLGMSRRTLQRRLLAEGVKFSELVSDTQRRLAEGYLADPALSLAEVAYLLGYRETTSFYRSFRRWKGMTPAAFRANLA